MTQMKLIESVRHMKLASLRTCALKKKKKDLEELQHSSIVERSLMFFIPGDWKQECHEYNRMICNVLISNPTACG